MGFLDKVKEKAQQGLEKGQGVAKEQQLKHELRGLDRELDDAYASFGRAAYGLRSAGTLSASDLEAEAQVVRDAEAARDAKQAEIDEVGESDEPDESGAPDAPGPAGAAGGSPETPAGG
jgi:hypothetical protein